MGEKTQQPDNSKLKRWAVAVILPLIPALAVYYGMVELNWPLESLSIVHATLQVPEGTLSLQHTAHVVAVEIYVICFLPLTLRRRRGRESHVERLIAMLEDELRVKDAQIGSLLGHGRPVPTPIPSEEARELAAQIPDSVDAYALALKAIAESRFADARQLLDQAEGEKKADLVDVYSARGNAEYEADHYGESAAYYLKALDISPDDPPLLSAAGLSLLNGGRYQDAEPLLERALEMRERVLGPDHPDVAASLNDLAGLYRNTGRYEDAEARLVRALSVREKVLGGDHPDVAVSLNNLAGLFVDTGRIEEAEPLYLRALGLFENALGSDHPLVAASLNNLAGLYRNTGRYQEAELLFKRALRIRERAFGPDHPDSAAGLGNLAGLYVNTGRYQEAEPLFERALRIREKALGPDHPDVAQSLNRLAGFYRVTQRYEDAEPLYERAIAIYEKALGTGHPHSIQCMENYATLLREMNRTEAADALEKRVRAVRYKHGHRDG